MLGLGAWTDTPPEKSLWRPKRMCWLNGSLRVKNVLYFFGYVSFICIDLNEHVCNVTIGNGSLCVNWR